MRSTAYMNHYPHHRPADNREAVTADLTASVAELSSSSNNRGWAVAATMRELGIDSLLHLGVSSDMLLIGSQEVMHARQRVLRQNIGLIASQATEVEGPKGASRNELADAIDSVSESLNKSEHPLGFIGEAGELLRHFGEQCNDDGCNVGFGQKQGWYSALANRKRNYLELSEDAKALVPPTVDFDDLDEAEAYRERVVRTMGLDWLIKEQQTDQTHDSDALSAKYQSELSLNTEAFKKASDYVFKMTGKPISDLVMAENIVFDLVDTQRKQILYERDTAEMMDRIYRPDSQD